MKSYSELTKLGSYAERLNYLKLMDRVGSKKQIVNSAESKAFYSSREWRTLRAQIVARDGGMDLGVADTPITGRAEVHHINPISAEDLMAHSPMVYDPENLITVSSETHKRIHYGTKIEDPIERSPNDTIPWR